MHLDNSNRAFECSCIVNNATIRGMIVDKAHELDRCNCPEIVKEYHILIVRYLNEKIDLTADSREGGDFGERVSLEVFLERLLQDRSIKLSNGFEVAINNYSVGIGCQDIDIDDLGKIYEWFKTPTNLWYNCPSKSPVYAMLLEWAERRGILTTDKKFYKGFDCLTNENGKLSATNIRGGKPVYGSFVEVTKLEDFIESFNGYQLQDYYITKKDGFVFVKDNSTLHVFSPDDIVKIAKLAKFV